MLAIMSGSPVVRPPWKASRTGADLVAALPLVPPFPCGEMAVPGDDDMESRHGLVPLSAKSNTTAPRSPRDDQMEAQRRPATGTGTPQTRRRQKKVKPKN